MTKDEIERVAGQLTKAQREAIGTISVRRDRISPVASLNGLNTFRSLIRRGLVRHSIVGMVSCAHLTPFGLAVKHHLEGERS